VPRNWSKGPGFANAGALNLRDPARLLTLRDPGAGALVAERADAERRAIDLMRLGSAEHRADAASKAS